MNYLRLIPCIIWVLVSPRLLFSQQYQALKPAEAPPAVAAYSHVSPSIAMIKIPLDDDTFRVGAAFAIDSPPLLLTNYHVVAGRRIVPVILRHQPQDSFSAKIIAADASRDLAALKLLDRNMHPKGLAFPTNDRQLRAAVAAFSVGYTGGREPWGYLEGKITSITDRASAIYNFAGNAMNFSMNKMILIDMTPSPGHSGGPLISFEDQSVLGMVTRAEFENFKGPDGNPLLGAGQTACIPFPEILSFVEKREDFTRLDDLPVPDQKDGLVADQPAFDKVNIRERFRFEVYDANGDPVDLVLWQPYAFTDLGPLAPRGRVMLNQDAAQTLAPQLLSAIPSARYHLSDAFRIAFASVDSTAIQEVLKPHAGAAYTTLTLSNGLKITLDVFAGGGAGALGDNVVSYRRNRIRLFLQGHDEKYQPDFIDRSRVSYSRSPVNGARDRSLDGGRVTYRYRQYVSTDGKRTWLALYVLRRDRNSPMHDKFVACQFECPASIAFSRDAETRAKFDEAALVLLSLWVR